MSVFRFNTVGGETADYFFRSREEPDGFGLFSTAGRLHGALLGGGDDRGRLQQARREVRKNEKKKRPSTAQRYVPRG